MKPIKITMQLIIMLWGMMALTTKVSATIYTVTSTADAGVGTLRQAILDANSNGGRDTIRFNILTGGGNYFEGGAGASFAVIQINTVLPTITEAVFIDGSTLQPNTNTGSIASTNVGVDNNVIASINYPDVYIVPSATFVFPSVSSGIDGNGFSVDAPNVTFTGIAISGFGNTHTNGGTASGHSDIAILRSPTERNINFTITNCFISCTPTAGLPAAGARRSKSGGLLVLGNNFTGTISNNYIAHSGTYGIHFNGNTDNLSVGPASTTLGNRNWMISGNRLMNIATNGTISAITRVSDGITLMKCANFDVVNNYINDVEQMGIDIGYNSDSNYVANNTVTGFTRTTAFQIQAGLRIGLCSEGDTLTRNLVYNNTGTSFKAGIWIDRSSLTQTGIVTKNNLNNLLLENRIHNNFSSGIVLSTLTTGAPGECYNTIISRNSIYENGGLGIDLNFIGSAGATAVTVNDDGDADTGPNNTQNFPILDSVRPLSTTQFAIYGKAPAGSLIEFFITDGQVNSHGGRTLNYGEGRTFIGSAVEGSGADLAGGTGSYNIDGNIATNNMNMFSFVINYTGTFSTTTDFVTATATVGNNTSEFGPTVRILDVLDVKLISFTSSYLDGMVKLKWKAISDDQFMHFDVEHSTDGRNFTRIASVDPKNADIICEYEFIHANPAKGKNIYRLRLNNKSGDNGFSSLLFVNINSTNTNDLKKMNSFFTDHIELRLETGKEEEVAVQLFNEAGRMVKSTQVKSGRGLNYIQLNDLSFLSSGMYIIRVQAGQAIHTKKLIKQ